MNLNTTKIWPYLALRRHDFHHLGARGAPNLTISMISEPETRQTLRSLLYLSPAGRLLRPGDTFFCAQQELARMQIFDGFYIVWGSDGYLTALMCRSPGGGCLLTGAGG